MDPFEARMTFLSHLRRLNASQQSIQKVVAFAVRHFVACGEDLWDCIVEECQKGSINSRINILYFLDSLCETCLLLRSHSSTANGPQYVDFVSRDLQKVVESVVPEGRAGLPNLTSTKQILENWRSKRIIDPQKVDDVINALNSRSTQPDPTANGTSSHDQPQQPSRSSSKRSSQLSRNEIQKRIEEDRERHKRLRERRWVQPTSLKAALFVNPQLLSLLPDGEEEPSVDIEFDNDWETTSDWNEDDEEAAGEEVTLMLAANDVVP